MSDHKPTDQTPDQTPDKPPKEPGEQPPAAPEKRSWRRRLAVPVLIIAAAGLVAYWSRTKSVDVTVVYDLGKHAPRARRLSASFQREGGDAVGQPVDWEFPTGSMPQRRHRHKLELKPGTYVVRARLHLRALGEYPAEVRKLRRRIEIAAGQEQRITLRFR